MKVEKQKVLFYHVSNFFPQKGLASNACAPDINQDSSSKEDVFTDEPEVPVNLPSEGIEQKILFCAFF